MPKTISPSQTEPKLKAAKLKPNLFDTECPHCGGDLHAPSGSINWMKDELEGQTIECIYCHNQVVLPRKINAENVRSTTGDTHD